MSGRIQRRIIFSGHVQGVGFRASMRMKARMMELGGWVSNLWDGRVEAVAAGPKADVEALVEWCCNGGIPFARVSDVEVRDEPLSVSGVFDIR